MQSAGISWDRLTDAARSALGWAAAAETTGVGTRALVVGVLRATGPQGDAERLLAHLGVRPDDLLHAFAAAGPSTVDARPSRPRPLDDVPALTENAQEALARAAALADAASAPVDASHLLAGALAVAQGTARAALEQILPDVPIDRVADAYARYVEEPGAAPLEAVLSAGLGAGTPAELEAGQAATVRAWTPSVQRSVDSLTGDVTPSALVATILALHPEYGGGGTVSLDPAEGERAPAGEWVARVTALLRPSTTPLHGRLAVVGLARLDSALRARLEAGGFLATLESEVAEPLDSLFQPEAEADTATFELAGGTEADVVDPTTGIALDRDSLGVRTYVTMLAALIADAKTPMPLSIGLFGAWGSGKSTFMGLLRKQIEGLSASTDGRYLRNVAQIGFNAWHYADTNLWASLGDEIFEQLAGPPASAGDKRTSLRAELAANLQRRKELDEATDLAQRETARLTAAVEAAVERRRLAAGQLIAAAGRTKTVKEGLGKAWRRLGVDDELEQARLLRAELAGSAGEVKKLHGLTRARAGLLAVLLALAALLLVCLALLVSDDIGRWLAGGGLASIASLAAAVTVWLARARSGAASLSRAAGEIRQELLKAKRGAVATQLDELRQAEAQQRVLETQRGEVIQRVGELGRELAELSPGRRLYRFLSDRAESDEYRRHLGLISTLRKDFEQLVRLLSERKVERSDDQAVDLSDDDAPESRTPLDRVVLYIDDLDRCSPTQVVDVLQAVHLLLALELFVVVVGVDPRWLKRSLQHEYDRLLTTSTDDTADDAWHATPSDYLEKIFNVPFTLPQMTADSFRALLVGLARPKARPSDDSEGEGPPSGGSAGTAKREETPAAPPPADIAPERHSEVAAVVSGTTRPAPRPLDDRELEILAALAPLIETPREAKRLINLYRLIRSTRDLRPASVFLGDGNGTPGEYQAVAVLLGLVSAGSPLLETLLAAPPIGETLGGLVHRPSGTTWASFVTGLAPRTVEETETNDLVYALASDAAAAWTALHDALGPATALVTLTDLTAFQYWAPRVARFSFQLSPRLAALGSQSAAAPR